MSPQLTATIVGAGPAGLSAGIGLLRSGYSVTILEQNTHGQDRVCGAFLNPEAVAHLRWLGVLDDVRKEAVSVDRALLTTHRGTSISVSTARDGQPALALPRRRLEEILTRRFQEKGGLITMGSRYVQVTDQQPPALLVMAAGRFSETKPGVPQRPPAISGGWYGWNATFDHVGQQPGEMSLHFYPGGYVGLVTFADGQTNVCGLVRRRARTTLQWNTIYDEAKIRLPVFRRQMAGATSLSQWRGVGPLPFSREMRHGNGMVLVGDAAAVGDPFMGEGNGRALGAGPMVAEAVAIGTSGGFDEKRLIETYEAIWNRSYAQHFRLGRWSRMILGSPLLMTIFAHPIFENEKRLQWAIARFQSGYQPQVFPNFL